MTRYSVEPKTRKYVKRYRFLSFARKYETEIMDKGLNVSKKLVHHAGGFIGNNIADAVTKSNDDKIMKEEPIEEIIIPTEKGEQILNKLRRLLKQWNTIIYLHY